MIHVLNGWEPEQDERGGWRLLSGFLQPLFPVN